MRKVLDVVLGCAVIIGMVSLLAFAIASPANPFNRGWALYACSSLMTEQERAAEPRCP